MLLGAVQGLHNKIHEDFQKMEAQMIKEYGGDDTLMVQSLIDYATFNVKDYEPSVYGQVNQCVIKQPKFIRCT